MKLFTKKILCFLLCAVMILSLFVNDNAMAIEIQHREMSYAAEASKTELGKSNTIYSSYGSELCADTYFDINSLKIHGVGEKSIDELKEMSVDVSSLPSFIPKDNAVFKGHVHRVREQETRCDTVIYQNNDGTKSTYIFSHPVKYIDAEGVSRDKSDRLSLLENRMYACAVLDNNVKTYFPKKISDGISLQYDGYEIVISVSSQSAGISSVNVSKNTVTYPNAFGANTAIIYTPRLSGYKEDIVLYQNINTYEFVFNLNTNGLVPLFDNGIWVLKNRSGDTVASFGAIVITDSSGNTAYGDIDIKPSVSRDAYSIIVNIPEQFANAPSTQYPIYIDPTTNIDTVYETGSYYDFHEFGSVYVQKIVDVGVYSSQDGYETAREDTQYHAIGQFEGGYSAVIYKLFDFFSEYGMFYDCDEYQIAEVSLHVELAKTAFTSLITYPMKSTWDTDTHSENPIALLDSELLDDYECISSVATPTDPYGLGSKVIDVTSVAKGWARYNSGESTSDAYNPNNGFILKCGTTSDFLCIYSSEASLYNNDVFVEVQTSDVGGEYYIYQNMSGGFLSSIAGSGDIVTRTADSYKNKWIVEYIGNDEYRIRKAGAGGMYALYCNDSGKPALGLLNGSYSDKYKWNISGADGGGAIFTNVSNGKVISVIHNCDPMDEMTRVTFSSPSPVDDNSYGDTRWLLVEADQYNELESFDISYDPWLDVDDTMYTTTSVYPSNALWTNQDDFFWYYHGHEILDVPRNGAAITGIGDGIDRITVIHKPSRKTFSFTVVVGQILSDSQKYMVQNRSTNKFVSKSNTTMLGRYFVEQAGYESKFLAEWRFEYCGEGYYYIRSAANNLYLGLLNSYSYPTASVFLFDSPSNGCKWRILPTLFGAYRLVPLLYEDDDMALYVQDSDTTSGLIYQSEYANDFSYEDEWFILDSSSMISDDVGIIDDEDYYMMNAASRYYMTVDEDAVSNLINVIASTKTSSASQKWRFEKESNADCVYQIVSLHGSGDKALDVTGTNVDVFTQYDISCEKFTVRRIEFAPYQGCYVIMQDGKYVCQNSAYNVELSEEFSERAVWSLSCVDLMSASIFSFNFGGFQTDVNDELFIETFEGIGYSSNAFVNDNATHAFEYLTDYSSIFVYTGHGDIGELAFYRSEDESNGRITAKIPTGPLYDDYAFLSLCENNELAQLRMAFYLGCKTAMSTYDGINLVTCSYDKGAHFVSGCLDIAYVVDSKVFESAIYRNIAESMYEVSLYDAIQYAIDMVGEDCYYPSYGVTGPFPITFVGDSIQGFW